MRPISWLVTAYAMTLIVIGALLMGQSFTKKEGI